MIVYNLLLALIYLGIVIHVYVHNHSIEKKLYCLISMLIIGMVGLRHETLGPDTCNYLDYFFNPDSTVTYYSVNEHEVEPFYELVNRVIGLFTGNKYVFLLLCSVLSLLPIVRLLWKYSKNPFLSLFLFTSFSVGMSMFFLSFSMMRQILAIGIFALAVNKYIENGRHFNKTILLLLGCMVLSHTSSAMVALVFLLDRYRIKVKYFIAAILFTAIIGKFANMFFPFLETIAMQSNLAFYLTSRSGEVTYSFIPKIPYVLIYIYIAYSTSEEYCNSFWMKGLFLAICMGNFFTFGTNADRMCSYFYLLSFIAIPNTIGYMTARKFSHFIFVAVLLGYFTYKYYITFELTKDTAYILAPYRSCFE